MARTTPDQDHPLYWRIATALVDQLRSGAIPPGERLPGERKLAERFGTSRETVRQALQVLRRSGLVTTDRRGTHAAIPAAPVEAPSALTFPLGAGGAGGTGGRDRATVSWEVPSPDHARLLGLVPHRPTLVHRYTAGPRRAVTSFSAVALSEVRELARYRSRANGSAAELWRAYDWMRTAGLTLHHRDSISPLPGSPALRIRRRVHDQFARPLEVTDLVLDAPQEALVYEFTVPARRAPATDRVPAASVPG